MMNWKNRFKSTAAKAAPEPTGVPPFPETDAPASAGGASVTATGASLPAVKEPAPEPLSPADPAAGSGQALARLIERSGDLKMMLVKFGSSLRFEAARHAALRQQFRDQRDLGEFERIFLLDWFLLQHRLEDGRTVVEHFAEEHPELPEDERRMLLGWPGAIEGVFRVERRDGDGLVAFNLIDELTYRLYCNQGPATLARMRPGSFLFTRIAPVADVWVLSGSQQLWSAQDSLAAYGLAATLATTRPSLVFRNPKKLEEAWELQRKEHREFIGFFGSDMVVVPGSQLSERLEAYFRSRFDEAQDDPGRKAAERALEDGDDAPPLPAPKLPDEFLAMESVGMIYDEVEGLCFFPHFGRVEEAFAHPERALQAPYREAVLQYLRSPDISPMPLRRLAERYPEGVDPVCRAVLKQPSFSWARDGEALLRRHKATYYDQPPLPTVTPLSDALARAHRRAMRSDEIPSRRRAGRNDPCPCGSGKKFKRCCGA